MAAAVFTPWLLSHYNRRASNEANPSSKTEQEIPLVVKLSNDAGSNDWKVLKLCIMTGTNSISKLGGHSSCMLFSKRPEFLLNSSYTGTGIPLVMSTVISGYWMGPDDEEECGYVQALVQRIN